LIKTLSYQKGKLYAKTGIFQAPARQISNTSTIAGSIVKFYRRSFDYYRGLVTGSNKLGDGNILYAGEVVNNGGPWTSVMIILNLTACYVIVERMMIPAGASLPWLIKRLESDDQIPKRAVDSGLIDRFGNIDPTDAANSQRYSLTTEWHRQSGASATKLMAYGLYSQWICIRTLPTFLMIRFGAINLLNPTNAGYRSQGKVILFFIKSVMLIRKYTRATNP